VTTTSKLRERLEAEARALGFAAVGVARADAAPQTAERLRAWLEEGAHGDMIWMADTAERRGAPAALWPEVRSVISLGMSYAPGRDPLALADQPDVGRISVYAQGADYHDTVKKALKALARWLVAEAGCALKVFVDTAPVWKSRSPPRRGSAGRASTPTSSAARMGAGCSLAPSTRHWTWRRTACPRTSRTACIAARAPPAWTRARPAPFRRRSGSMRGAASPT
jgi:hypothetical protein